MTKLLLTTLGERWELIRRSSSRFIQSRFQLFGDWIQNNWFRLLLIGILSFILLKKDVTLQLSMVNGQSFSTYPATDIGQMISPRESAQVRHVPVSGLSKTSHAQKRAYIERFAAVAQSEMKKYGIPASIKLAQGLLETSAGTSSLATEFNNHFGIKCFQKKCRRGHCGNFTDDSHKDFFRIYQTAWESFRKHSLFLQGDRYRHLYKLAPTDYQGWAKGLEEAGYATDGQYAEKLIALIDDLKLYQYDR